MARLTNISNLLIHLAAEKTLLIPVEEKAKADALSAAKPAEPSSASPAPLPVAPAVVSEAKAAEKEPVQAEEPKKASRLPSS